MVAPLSWMALSVAAFAPTARFPSPPLRRATVAPVVTAAIEPPSLSDDLKPRFGRGDSETKTSFAPDRPKAPAASAPAAAGAATTTPTSGTVAAASNSNDKLLAEIRALQPPEKAPRAERTEVDLNGITPQFLLLGALSYGVVGFLGVQFTVTAGAYFGAHPMDDSFYVVQRLSTVARYAVIAMGALGTGVTSIAAVGQLALAVRVAAGIATGELDPNAERVDPYGGRKQGQLQRMLALMLGDKAVGQEVEDKR